MDNGMDLNTFERLHSEFVNESVREVAYRVAMKLCEMKATKGKIYASLERHNYTDILNLLQVYDLRTNLNK